LGIPRGFNAISDDEERLAALAALTYNDGNEFGGGCADVVDADG